jgi:hypothetical protein
LSRIGNLEAYGSILSMPHTNVMEDPPPLAMTHGSIAKKKKKFMATCLIKPRISRLAMAADTAEGNKAYVCASVVEHCLKAVSPFDTPLNLEQSRLQSL